MLAGLLMLVLAGVRVKAGVLVLARRCSSAASACRRARACRRRLRARVRACGGGRGGGLQSLLLHTLLEETCSGCRTRATVRDLNR